MSDAVQHPSHSLKSSLPWLSGIITGIVSGVVLGLFLKAVQTLTGEKVYTLLLNIDFVPGLPPRLPEWIEFSLHLVVSVVIGIFYIWWIRRSGRPVRRGIFIGAASSLLYLPLSPLSSRVPDLNDAGAIFYWVVGHLLFGALLGLFGKYMHAKKRHPVHR
jgi:flagellar biosynthesis protein FliR